jgi:DNA topoisomerase-1
MQFDKKIIKNGKNFYYQNNKNTKITNKKTLAYVKSLTIPPAYQKVIISLNPQEDVAYIGYDKAGREQRIYSKYHNDRVTKEKYCILSDFVEQMPKINKDIDKLLKNERLTKEKLIAVILKIISLCYFRIGNIKYQKKYKSYGISTTQKKHITIDKNAKKIKIKFIGKKGVINECKICNETLIDIITSIYAKRKNSDIIFRYDKKNGNNSRSKNINSDDINKFLKKYNKKFTSKIYRTYYANIKLLEILTTKKIPDAITNRKKLIKQSIELVSVLLHHTSAICKKKYIDNDVINMYVENPDEFKKIFLGENKNLNKQTNKTKQNIKKSFSTFLKKKCI